MHHVAGPEARRISPIYRIVVDVSVEVEVILRSDRIELHETAKLRRVVPGTVIVQPGFRIESPPAEAVGGPGAGGCGGQVTVLIVSQGLAIHARCATVRVAHRVGHRDDRALMIHVKVRERRRSVAGALCDGNAIVDTRTGNIPAQNIRGSIQLGELILAVKQERSDCAADAQGSTPHRLRHAALARIVVVEDAVGAAAVDCGADETVLAIVCERLGSAGREQRFEVAVEIVAQRVACERTVLVHDLRRVRLSRDRAYRQIVRVAAAQAGYLV